jgi:dimethylargininase
VLDEIAVLTRPGAHSRQAEPDFIAPTLARYRPLKAIIAPGTLEGGDVLRIGRNIFVGQSTRTNAEGLAQLRALAAPYGYTVTGVPVPGALHLKTACTALDAHTLLANADWVDTTPFVDPGMRIWTVTPDEPWGANVLTLGPTRLVNAACPRTCDLVEQAGYAVQPVKLDEFAKAEAGLTCLSVIFTTAAAPGSATADRT